MMDKTIEISPAEYMTIINALRTHYMVLQGEFSKCTFQVDEKKSAIGYLIGKLSGHFD